MVREHHDPRSHWCKVLRRFPMPGARTYTVDVMTLTLAGRSHDERGITLTRSPLHQSGHGPEASTGKQLRDGSRINHEGRGSCRSTARFGAAFASSGSGLCGAKAARVQAEDVTG